MNRYEEKELQQEREQVEEYLSDYLRDPGYGGAGGACPYGIAYS